MPRIDQHIIERNLQAIKEFLQQAGEPVSIADIEKAVSIERRTLQRRLQKLQAEGMVITVDQGRSTRYQLAGSATQQTADKEQTLIPLSQESRKIESFVSKPLQLRKPVGYNQEFLKSYRPNVDGYLTDAELKKLADLGNTARMDQPAGTYAQQILGRLLIDLSWNSSRLEGNTYSLLDTQRLIEEGQIAGSKSPADAQMILNHKDAIEFIVQSADDIGFNRYTILNLHALLSNNLLPDPSAPGRLRSIGVKIGQSTYMPLEIPQQIEELFERLLEKADQIKNPFEQAFFVMVHLPYLQPFEDVNKRVSRLAANIPLNKHNLAPLSFIDVPKEIYTNGLLGAYELNRTDLLKDVFMWAYERSAAQYAVLRQTLGDPDPFRLKYRKEIKEAVTEIITRSLSKREASVLLKEKTEDILAADQAKFIKTVESELLSIHEGNMARYMVRPSEFKKWKEVWS